MKSGYAGVATERLYKFSREAPTSINSPVPAKILTAKNHSKLAVLNHLIRARGVSSRSAQISSDLPPAVIAFADAARFIILAGGPASAALSGCQESDKIMQNESVAEESTVYSVPTVVSSEKVEFRSAKSARSTSLSKSEVFLDEVKSSESEPEEASTVLLLPKRKKGKKRRGKMDREHLDDDNYFPDDLEFSELMRQAEAAIEMELYPARIVEGSSGSYFVKDPDGKNIGVFKPGDEEPYAEFNPKFQKFLQRTCCPCCFGRGCMVPNQGYLSEAGASIVDTDLALHIVPKTKVVKLASPTFNYSYSDRAAAATKKHVMEHFPRVGRRFSRIGLPKKIGSFQMFVNGYEPASSCVNRLNNDDIGEVAAKEFLLQFQKLVILDYIIRNTDRGNDNWLIKYDQADVATDEVGDELTDTTTTEWNMVAHPKILLAAIDNGLAFPYKHPDEWRMYPYYWFWLPEAEKPFDQAIIDLVLPKISDMNFVENLVDKLWNCFIVDENFDDDVFAKQMAVMRGQILNLVQAMKDGKSPRALVEMTAITVERRQRGDAAISGRQEASYLERVPDRRPFFRWC